MKKLTHGMGGAMLIAGLVVACGGGGSEDLMSGIDRLGVSNGVVTGFGSIFVNGVEYETNTGTEFSLDDAIGSETELQVGDIVTISWSSGDNGRTFQAAKVIYDDTVGGPIAIIDAAAQSFEVLGQTVFVDPTTSFDPRIEGGALSGLNPGDNVNVSGFLNARGEILASRVKLRSPINEREVRGIVRALTATTFEINALVINYATAQLDLQGELSNGDFVEAKGDILNALGQLVARTVEMEPRGLPAPGSGEVGEVEGFVTAFTSTASFSVARLPVVTRDGTVITGTLVLDAKVEVEGVFNAAGVLVADKIKVKTGTGGGLVNGGLLGAVQSRPSGGQLQVLGVLVKVTPGTRFEDQRDNQRPFGLAEVLVGDYVEVRGTVQPDGSLTAALLTRIRQKPIGLLRGPASAFNNRPQVTVLGQTATTDQNTDFNGLDDQPITADEFFNLPEGTEVKVKFRLNAQGEADSPLLAAEIDLEN